MIKKDEVAFLKTTGEAVFVLDITADETAHVRRPVMGQDGVSHQLNTFRLAELETVEEQRKRFLADREELVARYTPKAGAIEETSFLA